MFHYHDNMKRFLLFFCLLLLANCETTPHNPPDLEAKKQELHELANSDKAKGNYIAASQLEMQIISLDVNDPKSFITLSRTLKKQGYKAKALELLQTGERLNPQDETLQLEVGKTMLENGQAQTGLDKLLAIKEIRNTDYYNSLGVAYDMVGNHELAQDTFETGLDDSPDDGLLQNNLALSYILEGSYQDAIEILEPLTKLPDAKPKYRQNLALAYAMLGRDHEAYLLLIKDIPEDQARQNIKFYNKLRAQK